MWFQIAILVCFGHKLFGLWAEGVCTKFSNGDQYFSVAVEVGGRCVYGFSNTMSLNNAKNLCETKGTQLVTLLTEDDQRDVWQALGSSFGQHWVGLERRNGVWQWNIGGTWVDMTSSRWEAQTSGNAAYTMSSNRILLKMANPQHEYRPVCEEYSTGSAAGSNSNALEIPTDYYFLKRINSLNDAEIVASIRVHSINYCAMHCSKKVDCTYLVYKQSNPNCLLLKAEAAGTGSGYDCDTHDCFQKLNS